MADEAGPLGEIVLYQTEDGRTRVECRFADETLWLSQALIADLFQKDVRTINEHLQNIYEEGELDSDPTIRKFRIVRREGQRKVARVVEHYSLDAILAVGYRVRSKRGTQFRRWATERLREYLVKGFTHEQEIAGLNRIVVMWLDFAEDQARRRQQVFLKHWDAKLDEFLRFNERTVLQGKGTVSKSDADLRAEGEYAAFAERRRILVEAEAERAEQQALESAAKRLPGRASKPAASGRVKKSVV